MDIHDRLRKTLKNRGWTRYRLSKESGLSESTITNIFHRGNTPNIGTLEIICKSVGITLSQFFADDDMIELTPDLKQLLDEWACLSFEQREAILQMMKAMRNKKE